MRGRKGSKCYRFKPLTINGIGTVHHKLESSHYLVLRTKQLTLTLCGGFLPKHPGDKHKFGGSQAAWQKKADAFAKCFLVLFKPGVGCPGCQNPLNWSSFCDMCRAKIWLPIFQRRCRSYQVGETNLTKSSLTSLL